MSAHFLHDECVSRRIHPHSVRRSVSQVALSVFARCPKALGTMQPTICATTQHDKSDTDLVVSLAASTTTRRVSWWMGSQSAWDSGILLDRKTTTDSDLSPTLRPMSSSSAFLSLARHPSTTSRPRYACTPTCPLAPLRRFLSTAPHSLVNSSLDSG